MELKCNITEVIERWKKTSAKLVAALNRGFTEGLEQFEGRRLIEAQLSGRKSANYGLNVISGNARNALNISIQKDGIDTTGKITVDRRGWYLAVHQHYNFNGYIYPRNAAALAVPVHPAARGRRPADFQLIFIKRPGKSPLLISAEHRGKGGPKALRINDIMFVLKPRVYVPKRLYFMEEFATYGRRMIIEKMNERLRETNEQSTASTE